MITITDDIAIDERDLDERFVRGSGPGGQNVNKVATAVQLRFDIAGSRSLPDEVRKRLFSIARGRITGDGVLIIDARRFRTQAANRQDALERLAGLVRKAAEKPRLRRRTRPTLASRERRLDTKRHRAETKRLRQATIGD